MSKSTFEFVKGRPGYRILAQADLSKALEEPIMVPALLMDGGRALVPCDKIAIAGVEHSQVHTPLGAFPESSCDLNVCLQSVDGSRTFFLGWTWQENLTRAGVGNGTGRLRLEPLGGIPSRVPSRDASTGEIQSAIDATGIEGVDNGDVVRFLSDGVRGVVELSADVRTVGAQEYKGAPITTVRELYSAFHRTNMAPTPAADPEIEVNGAAQLPVVVA